MADFTCKDCVPPKRHVGCHATCEEYKQDKLKWEEKKKRIKENRKKTPDGSYYEQNKIAYADRMLYKKTKKKK